MGQISEGASRGPNPSEQLKSDIDVVTSHVRLNTMRGDGMVRCPVARN